MASFYMVKNSAYGRRYVRDWYRLHPARRSEHGFYGFNHDNGALHFLLLHHLGNASLPGWADCVHGGVVGKAGGFPYEQFIECFHSVLKQSGCRGGEWDRIGIWPHGKFISYDGRITYYKWSESAFLHHAMKNPPIESADRYQRPLKGRLIPKQECRPERMGMQRDEWYVDPTEFQELMNEMAAHVRRPRKNGVKSWDATSCLQNGATLRTNHANAMTTAR